jgi:hypothetical protein
MKNVFFILFVSVLTLSFFSCQKDDNFAEIIENDIAHKDSISIQSQLANGREVEINVDSLFAVHGDLESRNGKTQIYHASVYKNKTEWNGMNITRAELQSYNFHMEVRNGSGVASPYVFGQVNGGSWRQVKGSTSGTTKVITMTINDLQGQETHGFIGAYYSTAGTATITIFRETKSGSGSGSGSSGSTLSITPSNVSPASGNVNTTNFNFAVQTNPKPVSTMTATVEFKAPDNKTYTFTMDRLTQGFSHRRTLSQGGTYQYRYVVKYNGQTQTSSWMAVQVVGSGGNNGNNSGSYISTCLTSASSSCQYAKAKNAFHSDNSPAKNLEGECTWYAYGRSVELAENGHLPSGVSSKFKTAFWGKSGRSARYWHSFLGGTWHSTSSSALPQHLRKKGLLVVWVYGTHGHVAFVESVSTDKKTYTISEYNNPIGSGHKTRTLPFDGNDKLGGVYPQFLDLNTY